MRDRGKQQQRRCRQPREPEPSVQPWLTAPTPLRHYAAISSSEGDRNPIFGAAVCNTTISSSLAARSFSGSRLFRSETSTSSFSFSIFSRDRCRELRVSFLDGSHKNGLISQLDPGDVVAHIVQRSAAETRFAAIRLALADLISEPRDAVEQPLRLQLKMMDFDVQIFEVKD